MWAGVWTFLPACGGSPGGSARTPGVDDDATRVEHFATLEGQVLERLAAADPRFAARSKVIAPEALLRKLGTQAVLSEDVTAEIHGGSLDLFAFDGRHRALDDAARELAAWTAPLPQTWSAVLTRPQLERELLQRTIDEERARLEDESKLDGQTGSLVRGILDTWTQPGTPKDVTERDEWLARRLARVRDSVKESRSHAGDLDDALYGLERLLGPTQYPKAMSVLTELRIAVDASPHAEPTGLSPQELARATKVHLGVSIDPAALKTQLTALEAALRTESEAALHGGRLNYPPLVSLEERMLFGTAECGEHVSGSPVRGVLPPPERRPICGFLTLLASPSGEALTLAALHDAVVVAMWGLDPKEPKTGISLLAGEDENHVDALRHLAARRPVGAIGVALALEILRHKGPGEMKGRAGRWLAFGEAPLDVVARELK
jgi:hypothetical protein